MDPLNGASRRTHPIQVVARRTGLSPDVLRAWERRYAAITPTRTQGSRRLYSDEDIERLALLKRATAAGRSIGQVANIPTQELRGLVEADEAAGQAAASAGQPARLPHPPSGTGPQGHLERCLASVRGLDVAALEGALDHALVVHGPMTVMEEILIPLMHEIGDAWKDGELDVVHEHLASAVVRTFLGSLARSQPPAGAAPVLVIATPAGQRHELGALVAAVTAVSAGWHCTYLGPDLPAEEIAAGARSRGAKAVALGISFPEADPRVAEALARLRQELPHCPILLGGGAAASYDEAIRRIGARRLADMRQFREALSRIEGASR